MSALHYNCELTLGFVYTKN